MAALQVAGRRAASISTCITRYGGGGGGRRGPVATGLALYAGSSGDPLQTPPPANYRGDPSSFPSGGRWAASITRGNIGNAGGFAAGKIADTLLPGTGGGAVFSNSSIFPFLSAGPYFLGTGGGRDFPFLSAGPYFLGTGGGAVAAKIADSFSLGTGTGTGCGAIATKIAYSLLPGTGGSAVVSKNCDFMSAAGFPVLSKIDGRHFSARRGAIGILQIANSINRVGSKRPRPATTGNPFSSINPSVCSVRALSTMPQRPSNDKSGCFSRLWTIENKARVCEELIGKLHNSTTSGLTKVIELLKIIHAEQSLILEGTKKGITFKRALLWSPFFAIIIALIICILASVGGWYCSVILGCEEDLKARVSKFAVRVVHDILEDPKTRKDMEPYFEMGHDAVRRAVDPVYRWWKWLTKDNRDEEQVLSTSAFSDMVTCFAFVAQNLITSAEGKYDEESLLEELKSTGFDNKIINIRMLNFLIEKGYFTKETQSTPQGTFVYYHPKGSVLEECKSGAMKSKISKDVKSRGTLSDMLK